jgi:hypothetical protein
VRTTPETWRRDEHLPGSGTVYVVVLSLVQLATALLTLILLVLRVLSAVNWSRVDPFGHATAVTARS